MVLYAGHDNTSLDLLRALGQPVPSQWPPFANHLEFELWRERDSRKLKVRGGWQQQGKRGFGAGCVCKMLPGLFPPLDAT